MTGWRVYLPLLFLLAALFLWSDSGLAQRLNCGVRVNYEAISTKQKDLLRNFESEVNNYMNAYSWGKSRDVTVNCNIQIFLRSVLGENRYSANVFIGSSRAVYGRGESTPMIRIKDDNWQFTYVQNRPLNHNQSSFHDLASFLDFYANLILGYDYDSYNLLGGTRWFQKASEIANLGRSSRLAGWQNSSGKFTRTQLVEDILNPALVSVRRAVYAYHFTGLDSLFLDHTGSLDRMFQALDRVGTARARTTPGNLAMRVFFDAKHLEIARIFSSSTDPMIFMKLSEIDPRHAKTYEDEGARRE